MKFSQVLKSVAVAAAVAASGSSFAADYNFVSGTGTLTFDAGLIGALGAGGTVVSGVAPATYNAALGAVAAPVTGITLDATNTLTNVFSAGGALQTAPVNFAGKGGNVTIKNLEVVFDTTETGTVYASVSGANGLTANDRLAMWTFTSTSGSSQVTAANYASFTGQVDNLYITAAGKAALIQGLGLNAIGQGVLAGIDSYGTLSTNAVFAPVPEPSTYALMGVGLAAAGLIARRRAKTQA